MSILMLKTSVNTIQSCILQNFKLMKYTLVYTGINSCTVSVCQVYFQDLIILYNL